MSRFFVVVFLYYGFVLVGSIINSFIFLFECVIMFGKPSHHFEPFIPKSDKHLISLYNITPDSNIKVTRMDEMITN